MSMISRRTVIAGLAATTGFRAEHAFAAWPERNITLMHGLTAGGAVDVSARLTAEELSRKLGQPFVVEIRTGAAGTLAYAQVARATPDGYTLGYITQGFAATAAMYKSLPYHPLNDFTIIGQILEFPFIVVTHPDHPIHSISDLIRIAKSRAEPLLCGVAGIGTPQHLLIEYFSSLAGIKVQPVTFRGGNNALTELLGKRLDLYIDPPIALIGQIKAGALRAIAVTGGSRFAELPSIGTIAEAGFPGFSITSWMGVAGPAKLPADIATRLNKEIKAFVAEPAAIKRIHEFGSEPKAGSPEAFKSRIADDIALWTKVVAEAGIERI